MGPTYMARSSAAVAATLALLHTLALLRTLAQVEAQFFGDGIGKTTHACAHPDIAMRWMMVRRPHGIDLAPAAPSL